MKLHNFLTELITIKTFKLIDVVNGGLRTSKIMVGFEVIINSNEKMFLIIIGGGDGGGVGGGVCGTLTC